jgi:hypothetical protein
MRLKHSFICIIFLLIIPFCYSNSLSLDEINNTAIRECQSSSNDGCDNGQYIYSLSYNFNDEIASYTYTFFNNKIAIPLLDSPEQAIVYQKLEDINRQILSTWNRTDIGGAQRRELRLQLENESRQLSNEDTRKYYTITINANGHPASMHTGLPEQYNYNLIALAKKSLNSDKIHVERIYGSMFGGIIKYATDTGASTYIGYGHGFGEGQPKVYTQAEFDALKEEISDSLFWSRINPLNWLLWILKALVNVIGFFGEIFSELGHLF